MAQNQDQMLNSTLPATRNYQQEMLLASVQGNVVIAMDTGSGKTHIAVLRMKVEMEREQRKIAWFLAPTVNLCEQQKDVIEAALPVPVGLISGALEPDQWKDAGLWRSVLSSHRIMVSTPQVLLDALRHGYINLGRDISLLVFDEAHHAAEKHPYNMIMREFYDFCKPRNSLRLVGHTETEEIVRPWILGLTASPIFGGDIELAFKTIEKNLDSTILSPRYNRKELTQHVNRPIFKHQVYPILKYPSSSPLSTSHNVRVLGRAIANLNIQDDPTVVAHRARLSRLQEDSPDYKRLDQKLSKMVAKMDTFVWKGLRDFERAAVEICVEVGDWAAEWYVWEVVALALRPMVVSGVEGERGERSDSGAEGREPEATLSAFFVTRNSSEKNYLLDVLRRIGNELHPISYYPNYVSSRVSQKTNALIRVLLNEKRESEAANEPYSGLIFVTRRDAVLALSKTLESHPKTKHLFKIGRLLGASENTKRHAFLDITRALAGGQSKALDEFRLGETNLMVCTAVAEEGLDVQACGCVVRWDRPPNMVSWAQSRGRARKRRSSFVVLVEEESGVAGAPLRVGGLSEVAKWERLEKLMEEHVLSEHRLAEKLLEVAERDGPADDEYLEFRVASTGAVVTLDSAISHLAHFCNVLPTASHTHTAAVYDVFPPDYPPNFHARAFLPPISITSSNMFSQPYAQQFNLPAPIPGPFGATVTLPRQLPPPLRTHSVPQKYPSKQSARRHAAFTAYVALYEAGLLSENLLPVESDGRLLEDEVRKALEEVERREGLVGVSGQIDPLAAQEGSVWWWEHDVEVEGMPTYRLLTQVEIPLEVFPDHISDPAYGLRKFSIKTRQLKRELQPEELDNARAYTRMLLSVMHGTRMKWTRVDFQYLILPSPVTEEVWEHRREWADSIRDPDDRPQTHMHYVANAETFGKHYDYPTDISALADLTQRQFFTFSRWREESDPLTVEQEERVRAVYAMRMEEVEIRYPLIEARPAMKRMNFLVPFPETDSDVILYDRSSRDVTILLPQHTGVVLLSPTDFQFSHYFPSIVRSLKTTLTSRSLLSNRFPSLFSRVSLPLIRQAITAPVAQEHYNYQRLESLGDAILKFITDVQLLDIYPTWHEGYLTAKKDHIVSNASLARCAIGKELYRWIIRDRFMAKKWRPSYLSEEKDRVHGSPSAIQARRNKEVQNAKLSTKVLADVVEAIIGAAYLGGGLDAAIEVVRTVNVGDIHWDPIQTRVESVLNTLTANFEEASAGVRTSTALAIQTSPSVLASSPGSTPSSLFSMQSLSSSLPSTVSDTLTHVQAMLNYRFNQPFLLVEALMHASSQSELASTTVSYERMEFLGDSIIDVIVTRFLYQAAERFGKNYGPGGIHERKAALVNQHFLGWICMGVNVATERAMPRVGYDRNATASIHLTQTTEPIHLFKCLLHSSPRILDDQRDTFTRFTQLNPSISQSLTSSPHFPWAQLTALQAPKFFSDMIEALVGAVYLDSKGDFAQVECVLEKIGWMRVLQRVVMEDVDVGHPVSRLAMWAAKRMKKDRGGEVVRDEEDGESENEDVAPTHAASPAAQNIASSSNAAITTSEEPSHGIEYRFTRSSGRITCVLFLDGHEITSATTIDRGRASRDEVRFRAAEQAMEALSQERKQLSGY